MAVISHEHRQITRMIRMGLLRGRVVPSDPPKAGITLSYNTWSRMVNVKSVEP